MSRTSTPDSKSILSGVNESAPVIVIGGGISGLTAAWELKRIGVPVRVIETNGRCGGRIDSLTVEEEVLETGMQFYYGSYRETRKLLREFNLDKDLVKIPVRGLMAWNERIGAFDKNKPWLGLLTIQENIRLQAAVARQGLRILDMSSFDYARDEALDRVDVAEYFLSAGGEAVLELAARPLVNSYAFCEPEGHSLAMLCRILKLGGTAGTYGLPGGNASLPRAMAEKLDVVHASALEVEFEGDSVTGVVIEQDGEQKLLKTNVVICAVHGENAANLMQSQSELSTMFRALSCSSVILATVFLDRPIEGGDWCYTFSRKMGHKGAFAIDLKRRMPAMFPREKSVVQINFATPVSDALLSCSDDEILEIGVKDLSTFLPEVANWVEKGIVVRRPRAHPNFRVGMFEQVRAIEDNVAELRGLYLVGDYLRAPLCEGAVRSAKATVAALTSNERERVAR